jgi:sugar lactone lactonase YvrE
LWRISFPPSYLASWILITQLISAGAAQCKPDRSTALEEEIVRFERQLETNPRDAALAYNLAADYAAQCDAGRALKLLDKVAGLPGGLDPGAYRGFAFLHDSAQFRAIVAKIRATNLPRIQSKRAFTIKEADLFPEGMAYAQFNHRVYAGSVKRKIVWPDESGELRELAKPAEGGLGYVAGLHIDEQRKQLWAVSSFFGAAPRPADMIAGLFQYDLISGKLLKIYKASDGAGGLNDVTVASATGDAYTTNTEQGAVYVARSGDHDLQMFLPPGSVPGANGIALSEDEKTLFVAGDFAITWVDLKSKSHGVLAVPPGVIDASIDGLYFYRQSLVGIQNGIHPGRVVRFYLDPELKKITCGEVLETYNPVFENPTTGSLDGDSLLFMANTQLHKWTPNQAMPPPGSLQEIQILRLPLAKD